MTTRREQTLTKKQKKSLAFRQRGKSKSKPEAEDVPVSDLQETALRNDEDMENDSETVIKAGVSKEAEALGKICSKGQGAEVVVQCGKEEAGNGAKKGKGKLVVDMKESKKRKRREGEEERGADDEERPSIKKKKGDADDGGELNAKQRFILFVGNLKYTTSLESIKSHFSSCDPAPSIRLLTPKSKTTSKSKGCAFLEFKHRNALQQALKLHQSELEGRKINVELTAGGGGKSEQRLNKLKERNKQLHGQRTKRSEKHAVANTLDKPQRYSATSGVEQTLSTKRTWTVGDIEDGDRRQKHKKGKGTKVRRDWGTGVNAIPVG